jgi:transposase-like protein
VIDPQKDVSNARGNAAASPREFKREAVRLLRPSDRSIPRIQGVGVSDNPLKNRVKQAEIDQGGPQRLATEEREEPRELRKENRVLRQEREILLKVEPPSSSGRPGSGGYLQARRCAEASFPVAVLCEVLSVSRSGHYGWRDRPPSSRSRQDAVLNTKINQLHRRGAGRPVALHGCTPS